MKSLLKHLIENDKSRSGKMFTMAINGLIILSLISFSAETLPNLSDSIREKLYYFEIVTVVLFTAEYLARVWVADRKLKFVFSFFGLVDLFAILPFYLALGVDLRSVRVLRLLRLFRILKMVRYSAAIERCRLAMLDIKAELIMFLSLTLLILYVAAVGIYYFENPAQPEQFSSIFHSLWWSVATLTTVGYGDTYPITAGGRIFTFIVLMLGLGLVSVPSGLIASALTRVDKPQIEDDHDAPE